MLLTKPLLIAGGGALGAVCRYYLAAAGQRLGNGAFPAGTLTVNLLGCFLIGVFTALFAGPVLIREEYRVALMVGFLGGFTTFSTYGWETFSLLNDGQKGAAFTNLLANNGLGLFMVWLGYRMAEWWYGV